MTASKWWLGVPSLLLVIVLLSQMLACDALLSSPRQRASAVRGTITLYLPRTPEINRLLDETEEDDGEDELVGAQNGEEKEGRDVPDIENENKEDQLEPNEMDVKGEGEPPEPSPQDDGDDPDPPESSPPTDEGGSGGEETTPAPTPTNDEEEFPAPTAEEEDDLPTGEPTRPPREKDSSQPTPEPSRAPESDPPTDEGSPEPTPEPTGKDGSTPEPTTQQPSSVETGSPAPEPTTDKPTNEPTRDPTPDEQQETSSPSDPPGEEADNDSSQPSVELSPDTLHPSDVTSTSRPTISPESPFPSISPSLFPTTSPTISVQPTEAPSPKPVPSVSISDNVSVRIKPVLGVMSAGNAEHFERTAMTFLADLLIQLEQPIYDVDVTVTDGSVLTRRRRLNNVLEVDMTVSGRFDPIAGLAETEDDYSIGRVSRQFFTVQGKSFIRQLQDTGNDDNNTYFQSVSSVESIAEAGDNVTPAETPSSPGSAPSSGPGLAIGGMVAVALVGALVVALGFALSINNIRKRRRNDPRNRSLQNSFSTAKKSGSSPPISPEKAPPVPAIGGPSSDRGSIDRFDSDVDSELQWGAESLVGAASNMSYAYSLDDGIQQSPSAESLGSSANSIPKEIHGNDEFSISPSRSSLIVREITAPPGKLGVVLNTSEKGPVVQSVASGSPLEGMVWPGDLVIRIDGTNAKRMSAASVNEYMSKNLFKSRKLTMMSDPDA